MWRSRPHASSVVTTASSLRNSSSVSTTGFCWSYLFPWDQQTNKTDAPFGKRAAHTTALRAARFFWALASRPPFSPLCILNSATMAMRSQVGAANTSIASVLLAQNK